MDFHWAHIISCSNTNLDVWLTIQLVLSMFWLIDIFFHYPTSFIYISLHWKKIPLSMFCLIGMFSHYYTNMVWIAPFILSYASLLVITPIPLILWKSTYCNVHMIVNELGHMIPLPWHYFASLSFDLSSFCFPPFSLK